MSQKILDDDRAADPARDPAVDPPRYRDPFDLDYATSVMREILGPVVDRYFRPRLINAHRIPAHGPAILAPNHSGNSFPYDGMVLDGLLWQRAHLRPEAKFRSVFEKELAVTWWMRPFGIDDFWRRGGGVDLTFDNFDRLLARGERILYYPEGVPGIGKGFFRRYRLQRFSTSFVLLAARHGAPVLPVSIVNAEWSIPFCFTLPPLDKLMQKLFHVPFLPLPAAPLGILFPWMWYLTMPARMIFVVGRPIDMRALLEEAGVTDLADPDRRLLRKVADEVRHRAQAELDRAVRRYGRRPYQARSLLREMWKGRRRLLSLTPLGWPVVFVRHERDRRRAKARNRLHALVRDLDLAAFYLPFGWPLLTLFRRLRKPPYGFRGLSRRERNEREGNYHWHLKDRPLPPRELPRQPARSLSPESAG